MDPETDGAALEALQKELHRVSTELTLHIHDTDRLKRSLGKTRVAAFAALGLLVATLIAMRWLPVRVGSLSADAVVLGGGVEKPTIRLEADHRRARIVLESGPASGKVEVTTTVGDSYFVIGNDKGSVNAWANSAEARFSCFGDECDCVCKDR